MNTDDLFILKHKGNTFIDKFREAVTLYEMCKGNSQNIRALNNLLDKICLDKNSLYQNDFARHSRTCFLYTSSTPLSFKVLRYVYAGDRHFFTKCYKSKKETEIARSLELITEAMKI